MTKRLQTAANTSERGYVVPSATNTGDPFFGWLSCDPFEKVAELQYPQSIAMYSQMDNDDSRVTSLLEAITGPVLATPKRIDPNGASEEVAEFVSRNLNLPLVGEDKVRKAGRRRDRFSYAQHLADAFAPTQQYGHAVFEQIYRQDDDGKFWIRKLAPRPQWTIQKFNVAVDGGLESITQMPPAATEKVLYGITPVDISVNRLVVYSRNMRPGKWQGRSILRSAYKHWVLKNQIMRVQAAAAERNGMGMPIARAGTNNQDEVNDMGAMAANARAGQKSGIGLGRDQDFWLAGVQGNMPNTQQMLEYHDKMIALGGLAHFMNLDRGGSYALASVLSDPFILAENAAMDFFVRIANEHIVEDLVDINFGPDAAAPLIVADPIGAEQEASAASLKLLVDAGLLSPDVLTEDTLRQRLRLPSKPPDAPEAEPVDNLPSVPQSAPVMSSPNPPKPAAPTPAAATGTPTRRRGTDPGQLTLSW